MEKGEAPEAEAGGDMATVDRSSFCNRQPTLSRIEGSAILFSLALPTPMAYDGIVSLEKSLHIGGR